MINFHRLKCIIHEKNQMFYIYQIKLIKVILKKKTNYINYFRLVRNYKYELFIYIYKFEHGA